ncbi:MAG: acyl-protein synthetase [Ruminococcaceae bacterium]|nr:acyl-protein synthetase [Oscillospiraceae bacterium]
MKYRNKLFSYKKPYDLKATNELLKKAILENCLYQYKNCKEYRKILDGMGFDPQKIGTNSDIPDNILEKIPVIPTMLFKRMKMFSMPKWKIPIKATSSGTSGKNVSEIGFDAGALICGLKMVLKVGGERKVFSLTPCHYVIMGYQPHKSNKTAVAKTAFGATLFTPCLSRTYILKYKNGKYLPDFDGIISRLKTLERSSFTCRFMGFPAYTYFLLKIMEEKGIKIKLPKGSKILLGGGWKQFYAEQPDKSEFYRLSKEILGINEENIIEFFGAVEHPVLYCDCKKHHFHVPIYSRVLIRDVDTLKPLGYGETGLVNLITPMVKATPVLSVMTDDLGILHKGEECGCGNSSPYLEIVGRVAPDSIKTCAAGAAEMLEKIM